jgi:release factor glutamine methyltransferase
MHLIAYLVKMSLIYFPEEDSYLLQFVIKKLKEKNLNVLEIGCGSGIQLESLRRIGVKKILGADINPDAIKQCKEKGFNCVESNLFSNIQGKFDLIIFNPPYLPEDKREDRASKIITTGGKKGSELINNFLKQAKAHLSKKGKIYLLTSSLTRGIKWLDYKKKLIARKKLFFEELFVWELTL